MDIKEKMQTALDVIGGRKHPSVLRDILPAPEETEENWIRLAVDFLVARELERVNAPASNRFRLRITETKEIHEGEEVKKDEREVEVTDWLPERTQLSIPTLIAQKRQQYPNAAFYIERTYDTVN